MNMKFILVRYITEVIRTWWTGAWSSINGAARLIKDASPTPTNLKKHLNKKWTVWHIIYNNILICSKKWSTPRIRLITQIMYLHAADSNRPEIKRNATAHNSNSPDCQSNPDQPKRINPANTCTYNQNHISIGNNITNSTSDDSEMYKMPVW